MTQTLLAVLAWGWLLSTVWRSIHSRPLAIAMTLMGLLVAVQTRWIFWHTAVLTESLSATLSIAGVAAWWRWWREPTAFGLGAATSISVAWMLLRDSNAITFLIVLAPALGVVFVLRRRRESERRRMFTIAASLLVVAGSFSVVAQATSNRGETSFHNNVALRWLPDPDMAAWMESRGMPVSQALVDRTSKDAWADGEAMLRSPELADYRDWAAGRGRFAAAASFVVRADWYLERLWNELPQYTETDHLAYDTFDVDDEFPERPLGPFDPVGSRWSVAVTVLITLGAVVVLVVRRRVAAALAAFLYLPVVTDLYLSFAADAVEVGRHLVGPLQRLAVVSIVVVGLGIDDLLSSRHARHVEIERGDVVRVADGAGAGIGVHDA